MSLCPLGRMKTIYWTLTSKKDSRWNGKGNMPGFITKSPANANEHLKKCRKKYGKQPDDLMYEAHKK